MRILLVHQLYYPNMVGGAEYSVQTLAEGLTALGHEVVVVCTRKANGVHVTSHEGVKVYQVGLKNVYWPFDGHNHQLLKPLAHALNAYNPLMAREVAQIIEKEVPDVVHTHNLGGFSAATWRAIEQFDVPLVHTLRDYSLLCPRNAFTSGHACESPCWTCRPFAMPRRACTDAVDVVVGVSQYTLDRHLDWGYFKTTPYRAVIHNAYDVPEGDRVSLGKPHDVLRLGFLGGLTRRKGFGFVLKTLAAADHTWELYIGGRTESDYVRDLRARYESPHLHFLGYVNPADFFKTIDVLLVPSLWPEPFGRIVVEAYTHGVPVIASNRGGLREIVKDGQVGFTFDPNHPSKMIECIRKFEENGSLLKRMQQAVIQEAKRYRVGRHIQAYLDVYEQMKNRPVDEKTVELAEGS